MKNLLGLFMDLYVKDELLSVTDNYKQLEIIAYCNTKALELVQMSETSPDIFLSHHWAVQAALLRSHIIKAKKIWKIE